MTGFVVTPQPTPPPGGEVACDAFWPGLTLAHVRDAARIDTTVTDARLADAVRQALLDMSRELAAWRADQEALGHETLVDVPPRRQVDGESDWLILWRRGVCAVVAADLAERALGQSLSGAGADRAEQNRMDVDVHQRNVRRAVRDFLGRSRIIAEAL